MLAKVVGGSGSRGPEANASLLEGILLDPAVPSFSGDDEVDQYELMATNWESRRERSLPEEEKRASLLKSELERPLESKAPFPWHLSSPKGRNRVNARGNPFAQANGERQWGARSPTPPHANAERRSTA